MKKEQVYELQSKVTVFWLPETRAILDEWANYHVTLEEFQKAVMEKGLTKAKQSGGRAWVVDSSLAKGVFPDEVQNFIGTTTFKEFVRAGIKYFITVRSKSATTNLTIQRYERATGPAGIQLITVASVADAVKFLAEVDAGKLAA